MKKFFSLLMFIITFLLASFTQTFAAISFGSPYGYSPYSNSSSMLDIIGSWFWSIILWLIIIFVFIKIIKSIFKKEQSYNIVLTKVDFLEKDKDGVYLYFKARKAWIIGFLLTKIWFSNKYSFLFSNQDLDIRWETRFNNFKRNIQSTDIWDVIVWYNSPIKYLVLWIILFVLSLNTIISWWYTAFIGVILLGVSWFLFYMFYIKKETVVTIFTKATTSMVIRFSSSVIEGVKVDEKLAYDIYIAIKDSQNKVKQISI
ncbi:MAG: hypothetical protein ACD_49C00064G0025 [uncultured bacterium (gcode 4)]|uniref:Uncharacterized protein n=1 Tax=uncultured bacterium (gcode 4) TaxID=1234023 RepID=K2AWH0_9BACT|nr:MAG: hypothetical protein ACD_49C00064G0025 [uncultured bacterium (gcode 4)]